MDRAIIEKLIDKCLCKRVLPVSGAATCGQGHKTSTYLYKFREACEHFVLLLDGSPLIVEAGQERTEFIAKQFDFYGVKALLGKTFSFNVSSLIFKIENVQTNNKKSR